MAFKNNNAGFPKKLARRSLESDKFHRRILILTIVLATSLLFSMGLIAKGKDKLHKDTERGKAQVSIIGISENDLDKLKSKSEIDWIGESFNLGFSYQDGLTIYLKYENEDQLNKQLKVDIEGSYPQNKDEIILPKTYINKINNKIIPGDSIELDLTGTGNVKTYIVSGIVNDKRNSDDIPIWVSKELAKEIMNVDDLYSTAFTRLNIETSNPDRILDFAYKLIEDTSIKQDQVYLTSYFSVMGGNDRIGFQLPATILSILIIFLAGIMVYSVFYSSITKNIQSYGQLRTIGMTKKQVKQMVRKEGSYLALRAIPIGLLIGFLIGYIVVPEGHELKTTIKLAFTLFVLMHLAIRIFMIKPVKMAAEISPIESAKYITYAGNKKEKKTHRITTLHLAFMNLNRNMKKTVLTILVLSISGILVLSTSMVSNSLDPRQKAKFYYYPYGDIRLLIKSVSKSTFGQEMTEEPYRDTKLQLENNPINEDVIKRFTNINGVKSVKISNAIHFGIIKNGRFGDQTSHENHVPCITREEFEKIKPFLNGNKSYDEIVKQKGIILSDEYGNVGDKFDIKARGKDGKIYMTNCEVMATYNNNELMSGYPIVPGKPDFMMLYDLALELTGVKDQAGIISIDAEDKMFEDVKKEIKTIVDEGDYFYFDTIENSMAVIKYKFNSLIELLYLISIILLLFGVLSLVNIAMTNLSVREQEFDLLHSVGMTKNQISKMLNFENMTYTIGSIILTSIFGTIIGKFVCLRLDKTQHVITFKYPWKILVLFIVSMIVIQILLSIYIKMFLKKVRQ